MDVSNEFPIETDFILADAEPDSFTVDYAVPNMMASGSAVGGLTRDQV